jgi:hypothetical protein
MTLDEMIEQLMDLKSQLERDGVNTSDVEVKLAQQPSYPFEYTVAHAALVDLNEADREDIEANADEDEKAALLDEKAPHFVVYIAEGGSQEYLKAPNDKIW